MKTISFARSSLTKKIQFTFVLWQILLMYRYSLIDWQKKHYYTQNFFWNSYMQNLMVSEIKASIFNFSKKIIKKLKKKRYIFMIKKDWNFCYQVLKTAAFFRWRVEKYHLHFFLILILYLILNFYSTWSWLSSNTKFINFLKIFKKLWWFDKLMQWTKNRTKIVFSKALIHKIRQLLSHLDGSQWNM